MVSARTVSRRSLEWRIVAELHSCHFAVSLARYSDNGKQLSVVRYEVLAREDVRLSSELILNYERVVRCKLPSSMALDPGLPWMHVGLLKAHVPLENSAIYACSALTAVSTEGLLSASRKHIAGGSGDQFAA